MGRINAWKAGLNMFASRPLCGVGAGVFEVAYGKEYKPEGTPAKWMAPHSSYVQVLAETGLMGFVCFVALYYITFRRLWQARKIAERARRAAWREWHMAKEGDADAQQSPPSEIVPARLLALNRGVEASLVGFVVCGAFLTQAYAWIPHIVIGLSVAVNALILENVRAAQCCSTKPS